MNYKRIIVTQYGGPDVISVIEEECPEPKNAEVRVKILAAGVSLPEKKVGLDKVKQSIVHLTPDNLRDKFDVLKAFMVASISFYGKLFTQAEGRKVKLEENIFEQNQELIKIHSEIMRYRHNFSAHSGKEKIEHVDVWLLLDSIKERNSPPFLVRILDQPNAFKNKFLDNFLKVCNYLLERVNNKIDLLNNKYYENLTPEKIEMMYKISKM